jgi:hypothetical protein
MAADSLLQGRTNFFCNEIKHLPAMMNRTHSRGIAVAWNAPASPSGIATLAKQQSACRRDRVCAQQQ